MIERLLLYSKYVELGETYVTGSSDVLLFDCVLFILVHTRTILYTVIVTCLIHGKIHWSREGGGEEGEVVLRSIRLRFERKE